MIQECTGSIVGLENFGTEPSIYPESYSTSDPVFSLGSFSCDT